MIKTQRAVRIFEPAGGIQRYDCTFIESRATKDSDVIILNDEREWVFAIGLKLGEAVDEYVCLCRFAIEDCAVRLYIGHSEEAFLINTDESGSGEPAFAGLYNHYRTLFKLPLNTNPSKKQKMGFI